MKVSQGKSSDSRLFPACNIKQFPKTVQLQDEPWLKSQMYTNLTNYCPLATFQKVFTWQNHLLVICRIYAEIISSCLCQTQIQACIAKRFLPKANWKTNPWYNSLLSYGSFPKIFNWQNHFLIICQIHAEIISIFLYQPHFPWWNVKHFLKKVNCKTNPWYKNLLSYGSLQKYSRQNHLLSWQFEIVYVNLIF